MMRNSACLRPAIIDDYREAFDRDGAASNQINASTVDYVSCDSAPAIRLYAFGRSFPEKCCVKITMSRFDGYGNKYPTIRMRRVDGILEMRFHTDGGPAAMEPVASSGTGGSLPRSRPRLRQSSRHPTGIGGDFCEPAVPPRGHPTRTAVSPQAFDAIYWEGKHLLMNLLNIEVPVVAAINGPW